MAGTCGMNTPLNISCGSHFYYPVGSCDMGCQRKGRKEHF